MEKEFVRIKKAMEAADADREIVIKESRDVLKASKQAIYSLHRGEREKARELLEVAKQKMADIHNKTADPRANTGSFSNAAEEYAEGLAFYWYLEKGELVPFEEAGVTQEEYLSGLADLTGELGRQAVVLATDRRVEEVRKIKEFTDELYGQFVQFDFRNGDLRRKYDSIKYNLQKMERVLYDLTIAGGSPDESE